MSKQKNSLPKNNNIKATIGPSVLWIKIIAIVLILFVYGRSLNYPFVLDDDLFIKNNPTVEKGLAGIGETFTDGSMKHFKGSNFQIYRPMVISLFCLEYDLFEYDAGKYHFINILLYCLIAWVTISLLANLFPNLNRWLLALIALLFLMHPTHTEVVANVKSQDELLSALLCLSALLFFTKSRESAVGSQTNMAISWVLFLAACFAKESSFAFAAIFPVAIFVLYRQPFRKTVFLSLPYFMAGGLFLICRHFAIREYNIAYETTPMENILYGAANLGETIGTKLGIALQYLKMMVIPYPMSWDYSFNQIPVRNFMELIPLISLISYLIILTLGILFIRKNPEISFGLAFFIILMVPTASIFFPNGTTFADRFLFLPSLGFIIAVIYLLLLKVKPADTPSSMQLSSWGALISIFIYLSLDRTQDWSDNYAVFKSGAENSPNSSRTNDGLGTQYMNIAQEIKDPKERELYVDSAIECFSKSLKLFPGNYKSASSMAYIYSVKNEKEKAIEYYKMSLKAKPDYVFSLTNLGTLYANNGLYDSAYFYFLRSLKEEPNAEMVLANLTIVTFNLNKLDECISFGEKAIAVSKSNAKTYNILSAAYEKKGDSLNAAKYRSLAAQSVK